MTTLSFDRDQRLAVEGQLLQQSAQASRRCTTGLLQQVVGNGAPKNAVISQLGTRTREEARQLRRIFDFTRKRHIDHDIETLLLPQLGVRSHFDIRRLILRPRLQQRELVLVAGTQCQLRLRARETLEQLAMLGTSEHAGTGEVSPKIALDGHSQGTPEASCLQPLMRRRAQ